MGDRIANLREAVRRVAVRCGPIQSESSLLETAPVGGAADQMFLNGAVICETDLEPQDFLHELLAIEKELGRTREVRWGNRTIDLDIILWRESGGHMLSTNDEQLTIPHPEFRKRGFVLMPAREIAGDWRDPITGKTVRELTEEL